MRLSILIIALLAASACDDGSITADDDLVADADDEAALALDDDLDALDADEGVFELEEPGDLVPVAAVKLVKGCTATALLGGHRVWLHFARPPKPCRATTDRKKNRDANIVYELTRLIDSVPDGGQIKGHLFNITIESVAAALLRAQNKRHVKVTISTDGQLRSSSNPLKKKYLDKLNGLVYCGGITSHRGCIAKAKGAVAHTKLLTFSKATAPDGKVSNDVVWFSSANPTGLGGMGLYNNSVTVYGDEGLFDQLGDYLGDLHAQRKTTDYYDPEAVRGYSEADTADVFASPEKQTDLVVNRLDDLTPTSACKVRVMQASVRDTRLRVVDQLVKMKKGGCDVWVVANTYGKKALARLKKAGITVRETNIHDKSFLIYGKYGGAMRYQVYTGSHNLSGSANSKFDDILVRLAAESGSNHPVYDAYMDHFNGAYNRAKRR